MKDKRTAEPISGCQRRSALRRETLFPEQKDSVGARLRALRRERELSVAELALKAGVSTGVVSQIERDVANPSLRTLEHIRAALDIPMMALLEDRAERTASPETGKAPEFVRRGEARPRLRVGPHGVTKQLLSPGQITDGLQFMIIMMPPGVTSDDVLVGSGEKAGLVIKGKARLIVDGTAAILSEGDSFQFASAVPHSLHNDGDVTTEVLWIMSMNTPIKHL